MTDNSKMLLGMAGGAIAGVILGFLLAPAKGSNTRKNIVHTTGTWVNQFGQLFTKGKRAANQELYRVRQRKFAAEDRVNKLKQGLG